MPPNLGHKHQTVFPDPDLLRPGDPQASVVEKTAPRLLRVKFRKGHHSDCREGGLHTQSVYLQYLAYGTIDSGPESVEISIIASVDRYADGETGRSTINTLEYPSKTLTPHARHLIRLITITRRVKIKKMMKTLGILPSLTWVAEGLIHGMDSLRRWACSWLPVSMPVSMPTHHHAVIAFKSAPSLHTTMSSMYAHSTRRRPPGYSVTHNCRSMLLITAMSGLGRWHQPGD
jgi:hypothetical protein